MTDQNVEPTVATQQPDDSQEELTLLKKRADILGVSYHTNIGLDKLKERVQAAQQETPEQPVIKQQTLTKQEAHLKMQSRLRREASKLIRVRVTCMNPLKKDWEGEIFTAGNSMVGTYKKYVPFNNADGWHVPQIILGMIQERECQIFYTERGLKGKSTRKGKNVKEFNVEIMPALTPAELKELATQQARSHSLN